MDIKNCVIGQAVVVLTFNPNTQVAEVGGSLYVQASLVYKS